MKKTFKIIGSVLLSVMIAVGAFCFSVSAATASVSLGINNGGKFRVGNTVTVTVKYTASDAIGAAEANIKFSTGVLKYSSAAGGDATVGNGAVKIIDTGFNGTSKTATYTVKFIAIANGDGSVSASVTGVNIAGTRMSASSSVSVNVSRSENATLSSLTVSGAALSPAFNPNTTSYTAFVKNPVDSVLVKAGVADAGATVAGAGTVKLKVGENSVTLTVTAANGTAKKSYTVKIKRMTEEETKAYEQQLRDSDPLLVEIDGKDYHLVSDAAAYTAFGGFTVGEITRKDTKIPCLSDEAGKYTLCYLTADEDEQKTNVLYIKNEENYTVAPYIISNNKLYIIEESPKTVPEGFKKTEVEINGVKVKAMQFTSDKMVDFFILYCYNSGNNSYFRYDFEEKTLQRAPDFETGEVKAVNETKNGIFDKFLKLSSSAKLIVVFLLLAAVCIVVLIILLIVRLVSRKRRNSFADFEDDSEGLFINEEITDGLNFVGDDTLSDQNDFPEQ